MLCINGQGSQEFTAYRESKPHVVLYDWFYTSLGLNILSIPKSNHQPPHNQDIPEVSNNVQIGDDRWADIKPYLEYQVFLPITSYRHVAELQNGIKFLRNYTIRGITLEKCCSLMLIISVISLVERTLKPLQTSMNFK